MDLTPLAALVLQCIAAVGRKYNTVYPHVSQVKLADLTREKHGLNRSIRTIRRAVSELREKGYIRSWQNTMAIEGIGKIFLANVYCLTAKAHSFLGMAYTRLAWITRKARRPLMATYTSLRSKGKQKGSLSHQNTQQKTPFLGGIFSIKTMPRRQSEAKRLKFLRAQAEMLSKT